jgi:nicotinamide-nucleotide amidase
MVARGIPDMNAEIIAIGTEMLLGQTVDTNSAYLAGRLARLGINVFHHQTVGDNEKRVEDAFKTALGRSDLVLATGGLGPTVDDVTRKAASRATGRPLVFHDEISARIEAIFKERKLPFPKSNASQAYVPQGATLVPNPVGTAPGFIAKLGKASLICLPGVPSEMIAMFEATVEGHLRSLDPGGSVLLSSVYRTTGISESAVNERILDLFENSTNPTVAVLAKPEGTDIRLTARAATEAEAKALLEGLGKTLTARLPQHIYGWNQDDLETIVGRLLATRRMTLAVAESLTGGLVTHRLTEVPGSTTYFRRGYVTYSDQAKAECLGVDPGLIARHGAVSAETAVAMAKGCREKDGADLGLATTGIAGPSGGSDKKPVGLVYIALADESNHWVREYRFGGERDVVKRRAAQAALELTRRYCLQLPMEG